MLSWLRERLRLVPPAPPEEVSARIERNKQHLRDLERRLDYLCKRATSERDVARQMLSSGRRAPALFHVRRAKLYEGQQSVLQGQMLNLDEATTRLEQSSLTAATFGGLREGAAALGRLHGELDADKIDDALEGIQDQYSVQEELSDAISAPVGTGASLDDDELLQELQLQAPSAASVAPVAPVAPVVPVTPVAPVSLLDLPEAPVSRGPQDPPDAPLCELRRLEESMCT